MYDERMTQPLSQRHAILLSADLLALSPFTFAAQSAGGTLAAAPTIEKLLAKASERRPSVALIDLTLPNLDIIQAVAALKSHEPPPRVIAFGPHVHEGKLEAARQAGCDAVISRGQAHRDLANLLQRFWAESGAEE